MIDFSSSLYLGMHHGSRVLLPWTALSTGRPSALQEPLRTRRVAQRLARLQGCEAAILSPSTLHLSFDLLKLLSVPRTALYVDNGVYPILHWGVDHAARIVPVHHFRHHDPEDLADVIRRSESAGRRPLVVTDGWCTHCGEAAPLHAYHDLVRRRDGRLLIDDTQALGILGSDPDPSRPYGRGGGGVLRWCGLRGDDIVVIASLAKGFGVPIAVLAGNRSLVSRFKQGSRTRVHCSPPSIAILHAAERALDLNDDTGEARRERLYQIVRRFRRDLCSVGCSVRGGSFPVQTLASGTDAAALNARLLKAGIRAVTVRSRTDRPPELAFVLTARHSRAEIERAVGVLARIGD